MIVDEQSALRAVDALIDDAIVARTAAAQASGPVYERLWRHIRATIAGGKRIRPRLLLLSHDLLGGTRTDDAMAAAAAFELLHAALLVHDDALDGDLVRRGRPNLQGCLVTEALDAGLDTRAATDWARAGGLLAGDLLLSATHAMAARVAPTHAAALQALIDECLLTTAGGELVDIGLALGAVAPTADEILRMMAHKTAAYSFAAPLRAGAMLADAGAQADDDLARIGTMLGVVYQLRDDLLGVFGDPERSGKSVDGDLREGKRTLLIAYAEGTDAWDEVAHLFGRRSLDAEDAERLRAALCASGARERTELLLAARHRQTRERIARAALLAPLRAELLLLADRCAERAS